MTRNSLIGLICLLLATPLLAADAVITSGIDLWETAADGVTFATFAEDPIPAGFFCGGSAPFTGVVTFQGTPLATSPPGVLGTTDTIMQRLDDAIFDERGIATTRMQFKALSMIGEAPVITECGRFDVRVTLADVPQPISPHMTIVRESDEVGYFITDFSAIVRLAFVPQDRGETLILDRLINFHGDRDHLWSYSPGKGGVTRAGFVLVDTSGDGLPDTFLPGTSNFSVGTGPGSQRLTDIAITEADCGSHGVNAPVTISSGGIN